MKVARQVASLYLSSSSCTCANPADIVLSQGGARDDGNLGAFGGVAGHMIRKEYSPTIGELELCINLQQSQLKGGVL